MGISSEREVVGDGDDRQDNGMEVGGQDDHRENGAGDGDGYQQGDDMEVVLNVTKEDKEGLVDAEGNIINKPGDGDDDLEDEGDESGDDNWAV